MKRIIIFTIVFALICSLFMLSVSAEEITETPDTTEEATDTATEGENSSTEGEKAFHDKLVALVSNGEIWAKIGTTLVALIALILAIKGSLSKITEALMVLKEFIAGKATKEETEKAITSAFDGFAESYTKHNAEISKQYSELEARNTRLEAVLSLVTLHLIKSPNARAQIMQLMAGTKEITTDVLKTVEAIEEEIRKADEESKEPTPALDKVVASVDEAHHIELG